MDREEVERLVAAILEALNSGDPEALAALCHPGVEFHSRLVSVEGSAYRGREGFERFFSDMAEAFADAHWDLEEIIGWRGEELLLSFRVRGRGRASGVPFEWSAYQAWTFAEGKPIRNMVYASRKALDASAS